MSGILRLASGLYVARISALSIQTRQRGVRRSMVTRNYRFGIAPGSLYYGAICSYILYAELEFVYFPPTDLRRLGRIWWIGSVFSDQYSLNTYSILSLIGFCFAEIKSGKVRKSRKYPDFAVCVARDLLGGLVSSRLFCFFFIFFTFLVLVALGLGALRPKPDFATRPCVSAKVTWRRRIPIAKIRANYRWAAADPWYTPMVRVGAPVFPRRNISYEQKTQLRRGLECLRIAG